jgi:adenine phosphoribosyltransferase
MPTSTASLSQEVRALIRNVPDFPKPGIMFRDLSTLLLDGPAFRRTVEWLAGVARERQAEVLVGIESRGFIFAAATASALELPLALARKPGKLPSKTKRADYTLEYGADGLEMHIDAIEKGDNVLIVDDLLATGGTAAAVVKLVEELGGNVVGLAFVVELSFLAGRGRLGRNPVTALVDYESE